MLPPCVEEVFKELIPYSYPFSLPIGGLYVVLIVDLEHMLKSFFHPPLQNFTTSSAGTALSEGDSTVTPLPVDFPGGCTAC